MNPTAKAQHEKRAQYLWTAFILMFFVLQAMLWTVAISKTAGDSSHAVVAGYDEQALKWDEVRHLQIQSQRLGWGIRFQIAAITDIHDDRIVTLTLQDRHGQPVVDPLLSVRAFHNSHAAEVQQLVFQPKAPGQFTAVVNMNHSGYWRFEGTAAVDQDICLINDRVWVQGAN